MIKLLTYLIILVFISSCTSSQNISKVKDDSKKIEVVKGSDFFIVDINNSAYNGRDFYILENGIQINQYKYNMLNQISELINLKNKEFLDILSKGHIQKDSLNQKFLVFYTNNINRFVKDVNEIIQPYLIINSDGTTILRYKIIYESTTWFDVKSIDYISTTETFKILDNYKFKRNSLQGGGIHEWSDTKALENDLILLEKISGDKKPIIRFNNLKESRDFVPSVNNQENIKNALKLYDFLINSK